VEEERKKKFQRKRGGKLLPPIPDKHKVRDHLGAWGSDGDSSYKPEEEKEYRLKREREKNYPTKSQANVGQRTSQALGMWRLAGVVKIFTLLGVNKGGKASKKPQRWRKRKRGDRKQNRQKKSLKRKHSDRKSN